MICQETRNSEGHSNEHSTLMDWCQDQLNDLSCQTADPNLPTQDEWKLKETSSYGKSSCVLPITFFDIQSNIQLLNECNPLSIQVVDCDKHPWYYKKYIRSHAPEKTAVNMEDSKEPLDKKNVKLVGEDVVQCIDLTENTCDGLINVNKDALQNLAYLNKLVSNENKMPHINITRKKKSYNVPKLFLRNDMEKQKACSQVNLSKIDLKHNTGLVGLRIANTIDFNNIPASAKIIKRKKAVPRKAENDEAYECFAAASKTLNLLGTMIVPVNPQEQCKNVGKDLPDTLIVPVNTQEQCKNVGNDLPDKNYEHKVPSQSSAQITVSKPKDVVKPGPKSVKKQRLKNKIASLPVSMNSAINKKLRSDSQEKLTSSSQPHDEKTNKYVRVAEMTGIAESVKEISKLADLSCAYVNNREPSRQLKINRIQHQTNETRAEDTSRSKSPIFPCNSKYKLQSELEKHLELRDKAHIELKHDKTSKTAKSSDMVNTQENMIFVKDWEKPALKCNQEPSIPKTLHDKINKNSNDNLNDTRSQQTSSIKNNTDNCKTLYVHDNVYTVQIDAAKQVIAITDVTTPTNTSIKHKPKSSRKCKITPVSYLNPERAIRRDGVNKYAKTASATNGIINQMQCHKSCLNNSSTQMKTDLNVNERKKNLVSVLLKHFACIKKNKHAPKVSGKPEKTSKAPPPKTGLPLPAGTVATKINLPIQTQVPNRTECPESVSSVVTSQHMNASLPKQPVPGTLPAYCKVNGISNNFVRHPTVNPMNLGNANMYHPKWDPSLHYPIPPFMIPPPLFLPPPPLPPLIEEFKKRIHSLQNYANKPTEEVRKNEASNLKEVKTMANPKTANNTRTLETAEETKSNEQKTPSLGQNLPPAPKRTDMPPAHQKKTMFVGDERFNLSEKNDARHNNLIQNNNNSKLTNLRDITITPVTQASALNCTPNTSTKISKNVNQFVNRTEITFGEKKKNDGSSSLHSRNNYVLQMNKSNKKPKPGPLCMKNRTGPFAVKNASSPAALKLPTQTANSQSKKGYSPPILPIPTFQTILAQAIDLQVPMRPKEPRNENPLPSQHSLYPLAQNRTPNVNVADKSSRKRLHFKEKEVGEVKKVKKISYDDYKNRTSNVDKSVDLPNDPNGIPGKKYARKSENSCKSVKTLADVVNQSNNFSKNSSDWNSVQILEI